MKPRDALTQVRDSKIGAYVMFDHKPSSEETADAVQAILNTLHGISSFRDHRYTGVYLKAHDGQVISDPLDQTPPDPNGRWSIGVKVSVYDAYIYDTKYLIGDGNYTGVEIKLGDKRHQEGANGNATI